MFSKSFWVGLCLLSFGLNAGEAPQTLKRVPGSVQGFSQLPVDNVVDGAMVLKSFGAEDLLNFQIEQFIAPDEPMKAGPQTVNVPGNFFFPKQSENWGLFRISLEKPEFGFYTEEGSKAEILTTSFKAPFSTLVDMAQNGTMTPSKLLPLISLQKMAYLPAKDWSKESRINVTLSQSFAGGYSFDWQRAAKGRNETDHVFVFQQTPGARWAFLDLIGNSAASGNLKSLDQFPQNFKALFIRLHEVDKNVLSIRALVRNFGANQKKVEAKGVAGTIGNVSLDGQTLSWDPIAEPGWMVILHQRPQILGRVFPDFLGLSLGFQNQMTLALEKTWVRPDAGSFEFSTPIESSDRVNLVLALTDEEVAEPSPDNPESFKELFDHTTEIRFYNAK
jgi:hypothetical protein